MIDQDAKEQPDTWVLLDNQLMIDAFLYKALLKNIHDSVSSLEIKSLRNNKILRLIFKNAQDYSYHQ